MEGKGEWKEGNADCDVGVVLEWQGRSRFMLVSTLPREEFMLVLLQVFVFCISILYVISVLSAESSIRMLANKLIFSLEIADTPQMSTQRNPSPNSAIPPNAKSSSLPS